MKYYTLKQASDYLKVTPQTIRNYTNSGKLECERTPGGQRRFTQQQLDSFLGKTPTDKIIFYARSSKGDKTAIQSQINKMLEKHPAPLKIYTDSGSGLNEKRPKLQKLLNDSQKQEYTKLIITNKDRLTRFGYTYLERYLNQNGVTIEVIEEFKDKTIYDELMQDFMSLIASFSGKFYKIRGTEQKLRLLKEAGEQIDKNNT